VGPLSLFYCRLLFASYTSNDFQLQPGYLPPRNIIVSAEASGDEIREEAAPIQPPDTRHPLAPFMPLVVPGILAVVIIGGVIYGVIPMWNAMGTVNNKYDKMRKDAVRSFSTTYQVTTPPPPVYYPGNSPAGLNPMNR
jgi:hypothetical protein